MYSDQTNVSIETTELSSPEMTDDNQQMGNKGEHQYYFKNQEQRSQYRLHVKLDDVQRIRMGGATKVRGRSSANSVAQGITYPAVSTEVVPVTKD